MSLLAALPDLATIERKVSTGKKVDGRTIKKQPAVSVPIRCRLDNNTSPRRRDAGRFVVEPKPTLLLYYKDKKGEKIVPTANDKFRITSRTGVQTGLYEADGEPTPIVKRSKRRILGWTVTVQRAEEV